MSVTNCSIKITIYFDQIHITNVFLVNIGKIRECEKVLKSTPYFSIHITMRVVDQLLALASNPLKLYWLNSHRACILGHYINMFARETILKIVPDKPRKDKDKLQNRYFPECYETEN